MEWSGVKWSGMGLVPKVVLLQSNPQNVAKVSTTTN